ncbi:hypothetical protein A2196_04110 [Candidatus Curtissbacteria bacterium RIFOXYA1_FULL_41_14]|uniref:Reverse transcriptase domain-containing protein n=1 Tax=Candidatus Curtissbacteria bacterium RIFOXYA1_FULL_41_14 TaxID=1797737 RepID=A0A1F5HFZ2_9BACT|nr:MAG: hypothetical protein UT44_C0031G0003 [Candidatus Levybacteria bacterium GW2011_GWA1_39_32]OGE03073.1 MAG: hypothetical protein A2196_04110 [Candidatus Curtissbacteria bacterium RIFOXYA1_FULL_41_14]
MNNFQRRSKEYFKQIPKGSLLFKHLTEDGYLPESWVLPPVLEIKLSKKVGQGDKNVRNPVVLFAPKTDLKWREFSFLHPNNYQIICEQLCKQEFQIILKKISQGKNIYSYSLPVNYHRPDERSAKQILQWSELQEDLMFHASQYPYILILDLSNCYHTMYTHSIEWACESVGYKRYGSELDTCVRRGMKNRTHGLPVGPRITDYIAELVLCSIDRDIEKTFKNKKFIGGRYRDNYFLLCNSKTQAEDLLKNITRCLRSKNQTVNSEKTKILETEKYFGSFWQIDYDLLIHQLSLNFKDLSKIQRISRKRLEAFVSSILRLSSSIEHERAVFEKALSLLQILRPVRKQDYLRYISLICRMYKSRTQAIPKTLSIMSKLADENDDCMNFFKRFLMEHFEKAYKRSDEFEILWLSYFITKYDAEAKRILPKLKSGGDSLLTIMAEFIEKNLLKKSKSPNIVGILWRNKPNTSRIGLSFPNYKSSSALSKILQPKFAHS